MDDILKRLLIKIENAAIDPLPSDNLYLENIFSDDTYQRILHTLPADDLFENINHKDATLADGRITRKLFALCKESIAKMPAEQQAFWHTMHELLTSKTLRHAILGKFIGPIRERFGEHIPELVTVPIFYRDYPGYFINIHTDAPYKVATMQFYFPEDESQIELGTSFHLRQNEQFSVLKTNAFKPNSGYAFVRTETSWHSVKRLQDNIKPRNSLALTIYLKGQEYRSQNIGM